MEICSFFQASKVCLTIVHRSVAVFAWIIHWSNLSTESWNVSTASSFRHASTCSAVSISAQQSHMSIFCLPHIFIIFPTLHIPGTCLVNQCLWLTGLERMAISFASQSTCLLSSSKNPRFYHWSKICYLCTSSVMPKMFLLWCLIWEGSIPWWGLESTRWVLDFGWLHWLIRRVIIGQWARWNTYGTDKTEFDKSNIRIVHWEITYLDTVSKQDGNRYAIGSWLWNIVNALLPPWALQWSLQADLSLWSMPTTEPWITSIRCSRIARCGASPMARSPH